MEKVLDNVLSTYQDRLINLSASNRSLVLKKIYKKRSFDLYSLIDKNMLAEDELFSSIYDSKRKFFDILGDPVKMRKDMTKSLEAEAKLALDEARAQLNLKYPLAKELSNEEISIYNEENDKLKSAYEEALAKIPARVAVEIEQLIKYSNNLNYLSREISAAEKESGKYELFVAYPFVEGKFADGTPLRAPLLLIPVILRFKNNVWSMKVSDSDILINKVFLYGYAKYNNINIESFDTDFSEFSDIGEDVKASLLDILKNNGIEFETVEDGALERFSDMRKEDFAKYENGQTVVKNYMVLGQFPLSNAIYTDYERMLEAHVDSELLRGLLLNEKKELAPSDFKYDEKNSFFYTGLDYSQEQAVNKLMSSRQLVIYGPPGTGKSYTISNIITDALCKNKKVLMVSKKKAALDVIYNKLSDVNGKIALIHDANKDKKNFYAKLKASLDDKALSFDLSKGIRHDELADLIEEKLSLLRVIENMLMSERSFGLSLQEMYIKSSAITDTTDDRYSYYKDFRQMLSAQRGNSLLALGYQSLKDALSQIAKDAELAANYIKYKKTLSDNDFASLMTNNLDLVEKEAIRENGAKLISYLAERKAKLGVKPELFTLFARYYYENISTVNADTALDFAKEYNDFINGELVKEEELGFLDISGFIKKLSSKDIREENKRKYEEELKKYEDEFKQIYAEITGASPLIEAFLSHLDEASRSLLADRFCLKFDISEEVADVINIISLDEGDKLAFNKISLMSEDVRAILDICYELSENEDEFSEIVGYIEEFVILEHIRKIESDESFATFYLNLKNYLTIVDELSDLMSAKNALTADILKTVWNDNFQVYIDSPNFKEFKRQAEKKRSLWPIRKYIEYFDDLVFTLFPCWLLSPETVSEILPLKASMFDLIIFDEASQIFVEDAIPSIYRGDMVAIAGDDKQLKPTSVFSTKFDYFDEDKTDMSNIAAFEEESLLDLAKVNYPSINLNYHYRSRYGELINFSNYAFYDGELNIAPDISYSQARKTQPIEFIKVEGVWEDRKNFIEASAVVELVADILQNRKKNETLGIITFNINQKDLIEDLLESKCRRDEEFARLYTAEKNRLKGNEDVSLFVKNIENVQGDERDIIIFSVAYAKNSEGRLSVNFGSLSQDGGENRLNVAISRSKRKVYVLASFEPDELKVADTLNAGPKLFKKYLQYAKAVSNNDEVLIKEILASVCDKDVRLSGESDEFVESLALALRERGQKVVIDAGTSRSKVDLAVLNPESNNYVLGIECDGKTYRDMPSIRERDIHRKRFLESRDWEIVRVWSKDWWTDKEAVLDEIEHFVDILVENERVGDDIVATLPLNLKMEDKEGAVFLGDRVFVKDMMTGDSFDVNIDEDKAKLNEFKLSILGKSLGEVFAYKGYEYEIAGIKK